MSTEINFEASVRELSGRITQLSTHTVVIRSLLDKIISSNSNATHCNEDITASYPPPPSTSISPSLQSLAPSPLSPEIIVIESSQHPQGSSGGLADQGNDQSMTSDHNNTIDDNVTDVPEGCSDLNCKVPTIQSS